MGSTATQMVLETADFELVGVYDPHEAQETVSFNDETAIPFSALRRSPSCQTRCLD